jgi:hypothetical protein
LLYRVVQIIIVFVCVCMCLYAFVCVCMRLFAFVCVCMCLLIAGYLVIYFNYFCLWNEIFILYQIKI